MSAGPSSARAARATLRATSAALAAIALGACTTPDLDVKPFAIDVRVQATGASVSAGLTEPTLVDFSGPAVRISPTELSVTDATAGDLRITFDNAAAPDVAFPASLDGQVVFVRAVADPTMRLPTGAPVRFTGFKVAVGTATDLRHRFLLGESTEPSGFDTAVLPFPLRSSGVEDHPVLDIQVDWLDFEPQDCGVVYYDYLAVADPTVTDIQFLARGKRLTGLSIGAFEGPWTVHHVQSWHRSGGCSGEAPAYTQVAAWR